MKKLKFLSIFIIAAILAGCAAETANNSATATLNGTQAVQTGAALASNTSSISTSEAQSPQTQGQATPAPTAGNTSAVTSKPSVSPSKSPVSEVGAENGLLNYITLFGEGVIQIDDYIYYYHHLDYDAGLDKGKTYRMNISTGKAEQINDVPMFSMTYYDGWIYYMYYEYDSADTFDDGDIVKFCRIRPDGSEKGSESELPYIIDNMFVYDGYLYASAATVFYQFIEDDNFKNDRPLRFKINSDGSIGEAESLVGDKDVCVNTMQIYDGWLYFTTGGGTTESPVGGSHNAGLYKCRPDGSQPQQVSADVKNEFFIVDDWLYYRVLNKNRPAYEDTSDIYRMRLDGSGNTCLIEDIIFYLTELTWNYKDGWIYFVRQSEQKEDYLCICCMREDGSEYEVICTTNNDFSTPLFITQDYIFFKDSDDSILWRMNLDGSNKVELKP